MTRLMSVAFTEQQVRDGSKDVTRRAGWWEDKNGRRLLAPGDRLTLCRKVMGRKAGEPLVRIRDVEVLTVRREHLDRMTRDVDYGTREATREGFPGMDPAEFVRRFFVDAQGIDPAAEVTRIEWRYLSPAPVVLDTADSPLFDGFEVAAAPPGADGADLSAGQRVTRRQAQDVARGVHPLTGGRLHPQASRDRTRESGASDPFTCGSCTHRVNAGLRAGYPKCDAFGSKLLTHSAVTDVRAWWPACPSYTEENNPWTQNGDQSHD